MFVVERKVSYRGLVITMICASWNHQTQMLQESKRRRHRLDELLAPKWTERVSGNPLVSSYQVLPFQLSSVHLGSLVTAPPAAMPT